MIKSINGETLAPDPQVKNQRQQLRNFINSSKRGGQQPTSVRINPLIFKRHESTAAKQPTQQQDNQIFINYPQVNTKL